MPSTYDVWHMSRYDGALVAVWYSAGFAIGRLQVRISAWVTSHRGLFSLPSLWIGKWVPAIAGKAKAGMAHSDCGWTCGCAGKTVKSLENTCHTWALLQWWFTTKRRYIKCMDLYLLPLLGLTWRDLQESRPAWHANSVPIGLGPLCLDSKAFDLKTLTLFLYTLDHGLKCVYMKPSPVRAPGL